MAKATDIDGMIAHLRGLRKLPGEVATAIAPALDAALKQQISAGQGPHGKPWPKRQDGGHALANAGSYLQVRPVDMAARTVVLARLPKPIALHDLGIARGGVKRQVLPDGELPGRLAATVKEAAERHLRRRG